MGVAPKKPKFKGRFVNQVEKTFGTKPGSGIVLEDGSRNNKSTGYWKWNGVDSVSYTHLTLPTILRE